MITQMSDRGLRLMAGCFWLMALLLTALGVSDLYWRFFAPPVSVAAYVAEADPKVIAREMVRYPLFGQAEVETGSSSAVLSQAFHLIGRVTSTPHMKGFAILRIEGEAESVPAVEGEVFFPGVTLVQIMEHAVRIRQHGVETTLPLEAPPVAVLFSSSNHSGQDGQSDQAGYGREE